jgi:hypothetical protein
MSLVDARGVEIEPGDVCLYGFSVGRSVAMAEAIVMGKGDPNRPGWQSSSEVSLTMSGRVRLRVIRRSFGGGEKPVVDVSPYRLVVLKPCTELFTAGGDTVAVLPPSPLPTQDEVRRGEIEERISRYTARLRETELPPDSYWARNGETLADYHVWCADRLAELRKELKALDE